MPNQPQTHRARRARACLLLLLATLTEAAPFRLTSSTVDSGGEHSQGARFVVEGTVGQAAVETSRGARFQVDGGFWPTATTQSDIFFHNSFED